MTANNILIIVSILVGVLALATAFFKAVSKVIHIFDALGDLTEAIGKLTKRIDDIDKRMYQIAVRGSQRR